MDYSRARELHSTKIAKTMAVNDVIPLRSFHFSFHDLRSNDIFSWKISISPHPFKKIVLDLGSIFNRYPGYNQRPLYQQGGYGGYFPQGGSGYGGPYGGGGAYGGGNPYGNGLGTNMLGI